MAGPFSGAGLGQFGKDLQHVPEASEGGALGAVAGLYLADKMGLIDLKNMSEKDKEGLKKNGVLNTIAMDKLKAPVGSAPAPQEIQAVPPVVGAAMPQSNVTGAALPPMEASDVIVGGPMNLGLPVGTPLKPMPRIKPKPRVYEETSFLDPEHIDSSIANFATLYG